VPHAIAFDPRLTAFGVTATLVGGTIGGVPLQLLTSDNAMVAYVAVVIALVVGVVALRRDGAAAAVRSGSVVVLLGAVLVVLVATIGGSTAPGGRVNLVPGASILALNQDDKRNAVENVAGNIMLFLPIGFFGVLALRRGVTLLTALGAALSVAIEVTQLVLGDRWVDVDDVLLNTVGTLIGAAAARAAVRGTRWHQDRALRSSLSGTER
jgi:hypothetical protein